MSVGPGVMVISQTGWAFTERDGLPPTSVTMEQGDDPYQILGVSSTASADEIKKAYRKLAVKNHPDKQTSPAGREKAQHVFARISNAYELLSDETTRREYDIQQEEEGGGFDGNATYDVPTPGASAPSGGVYSSGPKKGRKKKFHGKPVHFSDPYEVLKRAFKDEFGQAYPGAKYDYIKVPKGTDAKLLMAGANNQNAVVPRKEPTPEKKKGFMGRFRKKKEEPDPHAYPSLNKNETQLALREQPKKKNARPSKAIVKHKGNQLVEYESEEEYIDNRPTSMVETTRKVKHPGGIVETITEVKITRPDGSTETMRKTDNADVSKTIKNKKNFKMLTNGPQKPQERKMLTNGSRQNQKALTNGKPQKQKMLTNGSSSKPRGFFGRK